LAYFQFVTVGFEDEDLVKGLFLEQGAGHHVAGAVALTGAVYFFARGDVPSFAMRLVISATLAGVVVISDSKQVVAVFLFSLAMLVFISHRNFKAVIENLAISIIAVVLLFGLAYTIFPALLLGTQMDRVSTGIGLKVSVVSLIVSDYTSPLNWIVGLGPGHTVGRLAEILPDYFAELGRWGATTSSTTQSAINLRESHYLSQMHSGTKGGSSLWSPFFFWAGNWGDLGILGCASYLSLWLVVYRHFCLDDISRFFHLNVIIFGFVFGWLEEPGYTLFVTSIIGLNWQDQQSRQL
jgi:hypothetical protein